MQYKAQKIRLLRFKLIPELSQVVNKRLIENGT